MYFSRIFYTSLKYFDKSRYLLSLIIRKIFSPERKQLDRVANESSHNFLTQELERNRCSNDTTNKRFRIPNEVTSGTTFYSANWNVFKISSWCVTLRRRVSSKITKCSSDSRLFPYYSSWEYNVARRDDTVRRAIKETRRYKTMAPVTPKASAPVPTREHEVLVQIYSRIWCSINFLLLLLAESNRQEFIHSILVKKKKKKKKNNLRCVTKGFLHDRPLN